MIRHATETDLSFLVRADVAADGDEPPDAAAHRTMIRGFVDDPAHAAYVHDHDGRPVGALLARFRDLGREAPTPANRLLPERVLSELDPSWLPRDGRFTEVHNLWVEPPHRRRGIATSLKRHLEHTSRERGITLIYTHTEEARPHVVALNEGLGYEVVRRGPIWDATVRISLLKRLAPAVDAPVDAPVDRLLALLEARAQAVPHIVLVAVDGASGAGKSTLVAKAVARLNRDRTRAAVICGDDFYVGGTAARWDRRSARSKASRVIDWARQRSVLLELRRSGVAVWYPFDWNSDDWDREPPPLAEQPTITRAAEIVILEGAYSGRPELADLLDARVLVQAPQDVRRARIAAREGDAYDADWSARWSEAEAGYFGEVVSPADFDLVLDNG